MVFLSPKCEPSRPVRQLIAYIHSHWWEGGEKDVHGGKETYNSNTFTAHTHIHTHTHAHTHTHTHTYTHTHTHTHPLTYTCTYTHTFGLTGQTEICTFVHICACLCALKVWVPWVYVCMCVHVQRNYIQYACVCTLTRHIHSSISTMQLHFL